MCSRVGQVEHRPPGSRCRNRGSDQDDSVPEEQSDSRRRCTTPARTRNCISTKVRSSVQSKYGPWESDGVRRAGVSSFGVGGTNAHVVVEEAPAVPAPAEPTGPQVLLLSARTAAALGESRTALATALDRPGRARTCPTSPSPSPAAASTTSGWPPSSTTGSTRSRSCGRPSTTTFSSANPQTVPKECRKGQSSSDRVVFLFPGQGAQHVGMAQGLYDTEPVFAEHFDTCAAGFREEMGPELNLDLHAEIFGGAATDLERTDRSQPALFTVEYALAKLVDTYGVRAGAYVGHSIGEYVAATLAGVFDLETAIKTVSMRARLMHEAPPGAMVAVAAEPRCDRRVPLRRSGAVRGERSRQLRSRRAEGPDSRVQPTP